MPMTQFSAHMWIWHNHEAQTHDSCPKLKTNLLKNKEVHRTAALEDRGGHPQSEEEGAGWTGEPRSAAAGPQGTGPLTQPGAPCVSLMEVTTFSLHAQYKCDDLEHPPEQHTGQVMASLPVVTGGNHPA